jgi:hypothetical protein
VSGLPWGKFWWKDWLTDPALSVCSLAAQGLWMRMLCIMSMSDPPGHLILPPTSRGESEAQRIARMCLADARQVRGLLGELDTRGVFSRDSGGNIVSRRMIRDAELSASGRRSATKGWAKRKGQPKGEPIALRTNGQPKGPRKPNPLGRSDAEADSPPMRPRAPRSRAKTRKEAADPFRNGFAASVDAELTEDVTHAESRDTRPRGATVVPIPRRA